MAGISTKEIKNRIRSMESTRQITKAMEMVAASKLRKTQERMLSARPYFEILYSTIQQIAGSDKERSSVYMNQQPGNKTCYVVIAGDRGLAGGYNSNVLKLALSQLQPGDGVLPIGKKAVEFFRSRQTPLLTDAYDQAEGVSIGDCFTLAKNLCSQYGKEGYQRVCVVYTRFLSVLSQNADSLQLLPLAAEAPQEGKVLQGDIAYEPDRETVLMKIVPEYLGGVIYGALCESRASEQAARRSAMDSATQNAGELIDSLSLQFNRARQAAITQEITEIVAGS